MVVLIKGGRMRCWCWEKSRTIWKRAFVG